MEKTIKYSIEEKLNSDLSKRINSDSLRNLPKENGLIDFCSNDYLGFAKSCDVAIKIMNSGSSGSRLISGNSDLYERTEKLVTEFHNGEAGLIFNSGYDANLGFFSTIPQRGDTIIYDSLIHASIRDGVRLSNAKSFSFLHNNLTDLKNKIKKAEGNIFVVVESVYSMDGDEAPLEEICEICEDGDHHLFVDEAHSTGVFGNRGEGKLVKLGLEKKVFARLHTFGKAIGCHGAIIVGSHLLRNYLINFCRSFIYTTALPAHSLHSINNCYAKLWNGYSGIEVLKSRIEYFKGQVKNTDLFNRMMLNQSPIQCIIIKGNDKVKYVSSELAKEGFNVKPILYPTVPEEKERLRICIHTFNTEAEIKKLVKTIELKIKEFEQTI